MRVCREARWAHPPAPSLLRQAQDERGRGSQHLLQSTPPPTPSPPGEGLSDLREGEALTPSLSPCGERGSDRRGGGSGVFGGGRPRWVGEASIGWGGGRRRTWSGVVWGEWGSPPPPPSPARREGAGAGGEALTPSLSPCGERGADSEGGGGRRLERVLGFVDGFLIVMQSRRGLRWTREGVVRRGSLRGIPRHPWNLRWDRLCASVARAGGGSSSTRWGLLSFAVV